MESEDELDDRELPDPSDMDQDENFELLSRCPNCKKMIFEDSEVCPICGHYLNREEDSPQRFPIWVIVVVVVVLATMVLLSMR